MEAFTVHTGIGVPLRRSNVDSDQIIPAVYLKRVTRTGFEDGLFAGWRTGLQGSRPFHRARIQAGKRVAREGGLNRRGFPQSDFIGPSFAP